jgi:hypothetical protein
LKRVLGIALLLAAPLACFAQPQPTIFIDAGPNFSPAIAAAMIKKGVPAVIVEEKSNADFVLTATPVFSKAEGGMAQFARCAFAYCIGANGNSEVSVELIRTKDHSLVWAYQVRKANSGPLGVQSLSEAVAKHLKNDYLRKQYK